MEMQVRRQSGTAYNPVFVSILEEIEAGITLATNRIPTITKEILAGTMLVQSANTAGLYQFLKVAKSIETQVAATALNYVKGCLFNVGDSIIKDGKTTSSSITRIDRSAVNTVVVATAVALGTLATASLIIETASDAATTLKYDPDSVLKNNVKVRWTDNNENLRTCNNVTCGAVVRGSLNESILPYYVSARMKTRLTSRIRFE